MDSTSATRPSVHSPTTPAVAASNTRHDAANGAAKRAALRLARRYRRRELRAADGAADEIGSYVGYPDNGEQEQDGYQPGSIAVAQQGQRQTRNRGIGKPGGLPAPCPGHQGHDDDDGHEGQQIGRRKPGDQRADKDQDQHLRQKTEGLGR